MKLKKTYYTVALTIGLTSFSPAATLIGRGIRNGSFEADVGKQTNWTGVSDWEFWSTAVGGPGTVDNDSGTDGPSAGGSLVDGSRISFIQPNSAAFNMTSTVLSVGDVINFSWVWTLPGRGEATTTLVYQDGANVVAFGTASASSGGAATLYNGTTLTVQAGDAWVGKTVGLGVSTTGSYPEVDDFQLDVTPSPEPSSSALLGLGGLALILRRRK